MRRSPVGLLRRRSVRIGNLTDDALHAEIRHLRAALRRAEEDRDALEQRLAYANQQIAELRAKVGAAVPR